MNETRLGIGAKVLIGTIVIAAGWLLFSEWRKTARVDELAALPPCELAARYAAWRLAFEDQHAGVEPTGSAAEEFEQQNELFESAARRARESNDSRVLEELENITAVDSEPWIRQRGDLSPFVQVMLADCPDEVEALMQDNQR
ncbi:MAG: hypothetical protein PVJ49_09100 [Acidobacteriota bacterium]|jgi:hypothetical protein